MTCRNEWKYGLTTSWGEITAYRVEGARHRLVKRSPRDAEARQYMLGGSTRHETHVIPQIPLSEFQITRLLKPTRGGG